MTKQEAESYLKWYKDKSAEYVYLARFSTVKPFPVSQPEAGAKRTRAKIVLGIHEFQKTYEVLKKIHPNLSLERYNNQRIKLGL